MPIGIKLPSEPLILTTGRDFKWAFVNLDAEMEPTDFPAGDLFIEFTGLDVDDWHFDITGHLAMLKVESEVVDTISNRTAYQLVWLPDGEPEGGDVIAVGRVQVQGAA
ncbi:minor tail subunit [Mycobacterium phage SWU2]|uniref:Minor tail subunit n=1 Tax=Mycobacterium phage SWU2 TaxID=2077150 RepID=A0A2K9VI47_9CAUD|nr:minor tail subunit [Mycobacterium phage SWU2]AUV61962.1 minor tail subunit [Mycobacterium phage SWU2]